MIDVHDVMKALSERRHVYHSEADFQHAFAWEVHCQLVNHSALDTGRYDFINDICRLEEIVSDLDNYEGYAILLTNDNGYWGNPPANQVNDAQFRLFEGRELHGTLSWAENTAAGTKRKREANLCLRGNYVLKWRDYAVIEPKKSSRHFKYLVVHVAKPI